jgi:hypothetical protein
MHKRVGGHIVDVETWLDALRKEWGIPKQDSPSQAEPMEEPISEDA